MIPAARQFSISDVRTVHGRATALRQPCTAAKKGCERARTFPDCALCLVQCRARIRVPGGIRDRRARLPCLTNVRMHGIISSSGVPDWAGCFQRGRRADLYAASAKGFCRSRLSSVPYHMRRRPFGERPDPLASQLPCVAASEKKPVGGLRCPAAVLTGNISGRTVSSPPLPEQRFSARAGHPIASLSCVFYLHLQHV